MTSSNNLVAPAGWQSITGDANVNVGGDVDGDILVNLTKAQEVVQLYGHVDGYRDLIVRDEIDPSHVAWLTERFAEPDGFSDVVNSLREHKILFLHGAARTGRWTAGVYALAEAADTDATTINVIDVDEDTQLELRRVGEGAYVLLDMRTTTGVSLDAIQTQLKQFLGTVARAKAHLVVLLPDPPPPGLQSLYQDRIEQVLAPPAERVLRKHLDPAELPTDEIVANREIIAALASAGPADASRLADLVAQEYRRAGKSGNTVINDVLAKAVRAYGNWSADLIATYDKVQDPTRRSLLLTIALLNGSTTETQYWAERVLLKVAGCPIPAGNLLEGRGFAGRLTEVDSVSFNDDRARLNRIEYDQSVLQHVWGSYPELRRQLVAWVTELGLGQEVRLDDEEASGMANRFATLCATKDVVKYISQVAKDWAGSGKSASARLAVRLLTAGAMDERSAGVVHRQLNSWASSENLDHRLVDLVLAMCTSEFGRKYTDKALTRLGNLANHLSRETSDKVVAAVVSIVRDNGAFPQVLAKLDEWLRGSKERQKAVAMRILHELLRPQSGVVETGEFMWLDQHGQREAIVRIWGAVLLVEDRALVRETIAIWLQLATGATQRDRLLDMLIDAAAAASDAAINRIGALRWAADDWIGVESRYWPDSDDADERSAVYRALVLKIQSRHPFNTHDQLSEF